MRFGKLLINLLFLPGNLILKKLGVREEDDCGVSRSFINSSFWGAVTLIIAMQVFL